MAPLGLVGALNIRGWIIVVTVKKKQFYNSGMTTTYLQFEDDGGSDGELFCSLLQQIAW